MRALVTFWKFSRPHTIIGSIISICTLYLIVRHKAQPQHPLYLAIALIIGISCNIFIVGINQIADVLIDKINKPYLPIPSGELSIRQAKNIAFASLFVSLILSLFVSPWLFAVVALSASIGWAYSMPPFYLKKHHLPAALAITTVRGLLINVGGFMVFNYLVNQSLELPENVKILTLFVIAFSIAISWFKDLPDIEGDAKYRIKTFAILYSPKTALISGTMLVAMAYILTIYMKGRDLFYFQIPATEARVLFYGNIVLFILFILNTSTIKLELHSSVKAFYKRFWWFFFAEYGLYLAAYLV